MRSPASSEVVDDLPARPVAAPDSGFAEAVHRVLATLRADHRTCFVLFYEQELSVSQIGQILGCPEGTVKTWLHRARRDIAEVLRSQGYDRDSE